MKTSRVTLLGSALIIGLALVSCKKEGCTDPLATNYNSSANQEDGSCVFDGTGGGSGGGGAAVVITDDVTTPTTWSGNISVCDNITVSSALTIEEGTVISMCASTRIYVSASGSITAIGTANEPIIIAGETATQGFWGGIQIDSNNPNNQFDYVTVRDGGSYWAYGYTNIQVENQAKFSITNSTISNSEQSGLYANESASITNFANNTFSNNGTYGLNISANQIGALDGNSNYNVNNGESTINVRDATVNSDQTWKKTDTPFLFNGGTDIASAVVIEPGVHIQFESDAGIEVSSTGSLSAIGTSSEPILLEGRFASSGYWRSLDFESNNPNNQLAYVTITDGGQYWADDYSALKVTSGSRLELNNCTVSNSNSWGMWVGTSTTIVSGGATQTDATGVTTYNTITGNGTGANANCAGGGCTVYFD